MTDIPASEIEEQSPKYELVRVVGMHFRGSHAKEYAANLEEGFSGLTLEREPDNKYDANAIKVMAPGEEPWHLGYIEADVAAYLAFDLDEGQTFQTRVVNVVQERKNHYPILNLFEAPTDDFGA